MKEKTRVYLGSDCRVSQDGKIISSENDKIFKKKNGFAYGVAGNCKLIQTVQFVFKEPKHIEGIPDLEYLSTIYVSKLRTCLIKNCLNTCKAVNKFSMPGEILLVYNKNFYVIHEDLFVGKIEINFFAIGSGAAYALGAMLPFKDATAQKKIEIGLMTASFFDGQCGDKFKIIKC